MKQADQRSRRSTVVKAYLAAEDGQTLAEYVVLLTVIALIVLAVAVVLGGQISQFFNSIVGLF